MGVTVRAASGLSPPIPPVGRATPSTGTPEPVCAAGGPSKRVTRIRETGVCTGSSKT